MNAPYPRTPSTTPTTPAPYARFRSGRLQGWQPDYPGAALRRSLLWTVGAVLLGLVVLLAAQVPTLAHSTAARSHALAHRSSATAVYDTVGPTKPLPTAAATPIPQIVEAVGTGNYSVTIPGISTPTPASQTSTGSTTSGGTSGGTGSTGGHGKHKHSPPTEPPVVPTPLICAIIACTP